ncbi:phosphatidylserine decarboxylase [Pararhodospirillum oryzae]|uniref:Phosphatidylserine decarboxylase proenzyme n=1 Tax=Pararhodospirillum oryzae TaxID=478448 RepID=A0A512H4E7_9PROT|nr:phosphatidylserine decarboxylase [Pararhodospirillum oryzae]GEO80334.1 phosphatidylserine decarboxylase proenzyme [Pararhodospirillum oryzae]
MRRIAIDWKTYLNPPFHADGWKFVAIAGVVSLILWMLAFWLALLGFAFTAAVLFFFRNPKRFVPERAGLVVSPASGLVQAVEEVEPPADLALDPPGPRQRVSVFLSVFDCHVNRCPVGGTVTKVKHIPGKTLNATLDKASEENERNTVVIRMQDGRQLAFTQIAGQIARRIRCDIAEGQTVLTGDVMGLIRFGSKVDIYLPPGVAPLVAPGQTMVSGETVIADLTSAEPARTAQVR